MDFAKSRRLWKRRHTYRNARVKLWATRAASRDRRAKAATTPSRRAYMRQLADEADAQLDKWLALRDEASRMLKRRRKQEAAAGESMSRHFVVSEFDTHDGTPVPKAAYAGLRSLCRDTLEPMRTKFGRCTVISGHRHAAYNRGIGGARRSYHIYDHPGRTGQVAADVRFARGTPSEWAAYARRLRSQQRSPQGGVGEYPGSGFVHVDNRTYTADWSG